MGLDLQDSHSESNLATQCVSHLSFRSDSLGTLYGVIVTNYERRRSLGVNLSSCVASIVYVKHRLCSKSNDIGP